MGPFDPSKQGFQTLNEVHPNQPYQSYHTESTNSYNNYDSNYQEPYVLNPPSEKPKRRCCCCCCRSRASKIGCCTAVLLILLGIGIAAFFCWPRGMPKVKFEQASFPNTSQAESQMMKWALSDPPPTNFKDLTLSVDTDLHLLVSNPNLIDIKMKNITVVGKYKVDGQNVKIGEGALKHSVSFKAKGSTPFSLPFTLSYNPTEPGSTSALISLFEKCGFMDPSSEGSIEISYEATLNVALISWTGIKPTISNNIHIDCPISPHNVPADVLPSLRELLTKIANSYQAI
ncbi:hypothetical protein K7432_014247 [Basidiobolus ranarum]|uniref:Late embryogenesis abundant protein LEA-2 subgroup domain-containing protein n=1 Tax=Basidiobolus ranarum TaxID=34480 RepID=A0ABR2WHX0_9FUNG